MTRLAAAVLIASLYLPTLATPFDFIDDGNLVYPSPTNSLGERLDLTWRKIAANYRDLGPFRAPSRAGRSRRRSRDRRRYRR